MRLGWSRIRRPRRFKGKDGGAESIEYEDGTGDLWTATTADGSTGEAKDAKIAHRMLEAYIQQTRGRAKVLLHGRGEV